MPPYVFYAIKFAEFREKFGTQLKIYMSGSAIIS